MLRRRSSTVIRLVRPPARGGRPACAPEGSLGGPNAAPAANLRSQLAAGARTGSGAPRRRAVLGGLVERELAVERLRVGARWPRALRDARLLLREPVGRLGRGRRGRGRRRRVVQDRLGRVGG